MKLIVDIFLLQRTRRVLQYFAGRDSGACAVARVALDACHAEHAVAARAELSAERTQGRTALGVACNAPHVMLVLLSILYILGLAKVIFKQTFN